MCIYTYGDAASFDFGGEFIGFENVFFFFWWTVMAFVPLLKGLKWILLFLLYGVDPSSSSAYKLQNCGARHEQVEMNIFGS